MNLLPNFVTTSTPESWLPMSAYSARSKVPWTSGPYLPKNAWPGVWSMLTSTPTAASSSLTSGMVLLRISTGVLWYLKLNRCPRALTRIPSAPGVQPSASRMARAWSGLNGYLGVLGLKSSEIGGIQLSEPDDWPASTRLTRSWRSIA